MAGLEGKLKGVELGDVLCLESDNGTKYVGFVFSLKTNMVGISHSYPVSRSGLDIFERNYYSLSQFEKYRVLK